jgi:aerobic C4-dicarboxylate transport protein
MPSIPAMVTKAHKGILIVTCLTLLSAMDYLRNEEFSEGISWRQGGQYTLQRYGIVRLKHGHPFSLFCHEPAGIEQVLICVERDGDVMFPAHLMSKSIYKNLTFQVVVALVLGVAIGAIAPTWGKNLKPLGDGFIRLVTMVIGPIVFLTIVVGICSMGDLKKVGRVGGKAIIYFEIVTTLALALGLLFANVLKPGSGVALKADPTANAKVAEYAKQAEAHSTTEFLLNIIPKHAVSAFAEGNLLQILFFSVMFGIAVAGLGDSASGLVQSFERLSEVMFRMVAIIMKAGPIGAFGAMAYTVGEYGLPALLPLLKLVGCVYLTMCVFIFGVLAAICRFYGVSLWQYLKFIREEIFLVLGVSMSEPALPRLIEKLEILGCNRGIVGLVVPAGYSFNLDGTSIYLSMAVLFIAQAFGVHLDLWKQLYIMAILMLTSKGAAAVTGGGFITLAATLTAARQWNLPLEGLALLLGVDRFLSTARALTNLIGNGVATIVVSKMEGEFDQAKYEAAISGNPIQSVAQSPAVSVE